MTTRRSPSATTPTGAAARPKACTPGSNPAGSSASSRWGAGSRSPSCKHPAASTLHSAVSPSPAYISELRSRPPLAGRLAGAVIAEPLRGTAALPTFFRTSSGPGWALAGDAGHHKDPVIARGIADAFRDADLVASAVTDGWHGDLDSALAEYGRQRDQCAVPLSDANLSIARLDMSAEALGAAWYQAAGLEQALDDPAAVYD